MGTPQAEPGVDMDDGQLPPDAEHVGQGRKSFPQAPPFPQGLDAHQVKWQNAQAYLSAISTKLNNLGMNVWPNDFPQQNVPDFFYSPRDLPA